MCTATNPSHSGCAAQRASTKSRPLRLRSSGRERRRRTASTSPGSSPASCVRRGGLLSRVVPMASTAPRIVPRSHRQASPWRSLPAGSTVTIRRDMPGCLPRSRAVEPWCPSTLRAPRPHGTGSSREIGWSRRCRRRRLSSRRARARHREALQRAVCAGVGCCLGWCLWRRRRRASCRARIGRHHRGGPCLRDRP